MSSTLGRPRVRHAGADLCMRQDLKFSKVRWKYTQQNIAGGSSANTASGWDMASNRIAWWARPDPRFKRASHGPTRWSRSACSGLASSRG